MANPAVHNTACSAAVLAGFGALGKVVSLSFSISVSRASAMNEDILSILRGFAAFSGSLREASRSSNSVVRASFTNEDTFGTFQAVAAVSGSLEEMSLVFLFSCPCFMNERRQKRHFPGSCLCFGFVGGNVQSLPFLFFVLHERTKTKTALSRQLWQFRVRWRKRLWSFFSVVRAS